MKESNDKPDRIRQLQDMCRKGYYAVYVFAEAAPPHARPERIFSPFFKGEEAEAKKQEIEAVCRDKGWRKRVTIAAYPPFPTLSSPDEPYEG